MALAGSVLCLLLVLLSPLTRALSELGKWSATVDSNDPQNLFWFQKTMFNGTHISLKFSCAPAVNLTVLWYLRSAHCLDDVKNKTHADLYLKLYDKVMDSDDSGQFILHKGRLECSKHMTANPASLKTLNRPNELKPLQAEQKIPEQAAQPDAGADDPKKKPSSQADKTPAKENVGSQRRKRSAEETKRKEPQVEAHQDPKAVETPQGAKEQVTKLIQKNPEAQSTEEDFTVVQTWDEGQFIFIVQINNPDSDTKTWQATFEVSMWHPVHQYTSASEWPLMMFYMVMVIVYVLYGVLWLMLLLCYWRDILRIQYWIGGVILLGLLEKIVFYAEFQNIQTHGESVLGAEIFAEILCSMKRMLARVLVVIASLGYGIVKPRLGVLLNRVLGVGMLYLLFSIIEGILRVKSTTYNVATMTCEFALAFVDSCLVLWIFMSLVQTMKLLRLRRNIVKLSLYRHFTNTLIFAVIASVIFIIWNSKTFRMSNCQSDWHELWLNDAFWRFLFSIILLVIMFLWRPSANNQRYAFVPLIDEGSEEEEEEEQMANEGIAEGMKMRGSKNEPNGILKARSVDEDLKWVEENIPSSMADVVLPPLLDSDEEIVTTKFEMSKME
ncbi:transmembrane protein 87A-like isoform X2 [Pleurodeles waltl]|uniref:transmembrane protein 87A-like isoform X2 n=1 Tax=Pleurodeles waltl TaxID=8319 RepID=UPI003709910A